jgi:hypothetical protein
MEAEETDTSIDEQDDILHPGRASKWFEQYHSAHDSKASTDNANEVFLNQWTNQASYDQTKSKASSCDAPDNSGALINDTIPHKAEFI